MNIPINYKRPLGVYVPVRVAAKHTTIGAMETKLGIADKRYLDKTPDADIIRHLMDRHYDQAWTVAKYLSLFTFGFILGALV